MNVYLNNGHGSSEMLKSDVGCQFHSLWEVSFKTLDKIVIGLQYPNFFMIPSCLVAGKEKTAAVNRFFTR